LWIGSKFPDQLAPAPMSTFLQATVAALQPSQMPVVRIAAARAVWGFCSHLKQNKRTSSIDLVRFEILISCTNDNIPYFPCIIHFIAIL
jgi:hypothetical protein